MAVYTHLTASDISQHLSHYEIGELKDYAEIQEGVENSNYLITTTTSRYILTLFEKRVDPADLPYFAGVMEHLAARGVNCPVPLRSKRGKIITTINGQPCVIVSFLQGKGPKRIRSAHMGALGELLAQMHTSIEGFKLSRPNTMSLPQWQQLAQHVVPKADDISEGLSALISGELDFLQNHWPSDLPTGVIHADLFPDNVFYLESGQSVELSGVIDFYFACNDFFMYDLAITMNAWCFERSNHHEFNITRTSLLLKGYHHVRPISKAELAALPILARGAALRFLLTRCYDWLNPAAGALVKPKNPMEYALKLAFHQRVKSSTEYGL